MHRLFLIRHGAPEAGWGEADDPGLSPAGQAQAEAAALRLAAETGLALITSPMRRCRETAAPLERMLGAPAWIEPRVGEVAAPADAGDRQAWLRETFPWREGAPARPWSTLDPALHAWRADVLAAVRAVDQDSAVFTHFIAINAIVGEALALEDTIVCRPDHASITELTVSEGALRVVRLGAAMGAGEVR